ncbi:MAG: SGNH/GDSL hydrolase family protein [Desulfobacterales bacterium]|nr:SGNH/GDSL hydrolase family protein [Desulfobacterales bacterium]
MKHMKSTVGALFFTLICLFSLASYAGARTYEKVVVFGDSLSDHGNLNTINSSAPVTWSNGDVWVDYLARNWRATLTNRAYGGALTSGHLTAFEFQTDRDPSNDNQIPILNALGFAEQIQRYVAASPVIDAKNTLFALFIGGNDLLLFLRRAAANDSTLPSTQDFISTTTARIQTAITQLSGAGARHFLLINLPNLGSIPTFAARPQAAKEQATQLTRQYNLALQNAAELAINTLNDSGEPHTLHQFDAFTYVDRVIAERRFPNSTGTLVVLDAQGRRTSQLNTPEDAYLFWDPIHPTTKAHELLAIEINAQLSGSSSSCFIDTAQNDAWQKAALFLLMVATGGVLITLKRRH